MTEPTQSVNETHYVNHLRKASDKHTITAHEDVYAESGMKLIAKNVTINDELYDKLMQHKLLKPLDLSISIGGRIDGDGLQGDFDQVFANDPLLKAILASSKEGKKISAILKNIKLPDGVAGKLTVMRTSDWGMYEHSLVTAGLAAFAGTVCGFNDKECIVLATAGLLHEIGMLHIDPKIPNKRERLDLGEIKQISAHPIIAFMILQNFPEFRPLVTAAVVEHHERVDGSGYPHSLLPDKLSPYGQMLAIVEVIASLYARTGSLGQSLAVIRTRMERYNAKLLSGLVKALLAIDFKEPLQDNAGLQTNIIKKLVILHEAGKAWQQPFLMVNDKDAIKSPASLVTLRLNTIKTSMIRCGLTNIYTENINELNLKNMLETQFKNDPVYLAEMSVLVDDHIYQLVELIREVLIRWPLLDKDVKIEKDKPLINWIVFINNLIGRLPSNLINRR